MREMVMNNWFIACNKFNTPTARELAKKLGVGFGTRPRSSRRNIIRWGFAGELPRLSRTVNFPNPSSIINCSDKLRAFRIMKDAKVSVPKFWTSYEEAISAKDLKYPLFCRRRHHTMGTDIIIIHNKEELRNAFHDSRYVVETIPYSREYRVHIFNGKMISASKKYFREQLHKELGSPKMKDVIRNNETGWGYHDFQKEENIPSDAIEESKKAVKALGLIWGAVDIIRTPDKKSYVLEVNSAPGLRDKRVEEYANEFKKLMNENKVSGQ